MNDFKDCNGLSSKVQTCNDLNPKGRELDATELDMINGGFYNFFPRPYFPCFPQREPEPKPFWIKSLLR